MRSEILLTALLVFSPCIAFAQKAEIIVHDLKTGNPSADAVAQEALRAVTDVLNEAGREIPAEQFLVAKLFPNAGVTLQEILAARDKTGITSFWFIAASQAGNNSFGEIIVAEASGETVVQKSIKVRSGIVQNIPLLLAREAAYLLKDIPLKAKIVSKTEKGEYIIDAGQWHGIEEGGSLKTDAGRIRILQSGRFQSLVSCNAELKGDVIVIYLDQRID
ncbi:MAG: hypothetical protein ACRCUT_12695, partial [Spirochaetota bacterium]